MKRLGYVMTVEERVLGRISLLAYFASWGPVYVVQDGFVRVGRGL